MRDRIEAIGGTVAITSRVAEGTVVHGHIPFEVV
jgi:signal transduction histidine kinase